jgi:hypothetical protein
MAETPEQRVAELERRISVLNNRKQLFLNRAQTQRRKDRTRRAIVLGELISARAEVDPAVRKLLEEVLRKGVEERQQYLFPTIWPEAVRPSGRKRTGSDGQETAA